MIKKIFAVLLCLVMVVGCLAACNKDEQTTTKPSEEVTTTPTDGTTEPTTEATEPSEDVTDSTEDAVVEVDAKLKEVIDKAREALGEEFRANMEIPAEMYADMFALNADTYSSVYGFMPMISAHVDTLVGVKATDVAAVEKAFNDYVEAKKADRMQYPTNAAAMGAMRVVTVGDYVWLIGTFGATDTVAENGEEAILNYAKANVDKVVDIINTVCGQ